MEDFGRPKTITDLRIPGVDRIISTSDDPPFRAGDTVKTIIDGTFIRGTVATCTFHPPSSTWSLTLVELPKITGINPWYCARWT